MNTLGYEIEPTIDLTREFLIALPEGIEQARQAAASEALSYRGLHVGAWLLASGYAMSEEDKVIVRTRAFTSGNIKPRKSSEKLCAEKLAHGSAVADGMVRVNGIIVAGPSDTALIEGITDLPLRTLPPCSECYGLLRQSPITPKDVPIVAIGAAANANSMTVYAPYVLENLYSGDAVVKEPTISTLHQLVYNPAKVHEIVRFYDGLMSEPSLVDNGTVNKNVAAALAIKTIMSV